MDSIVTTENRKSASDPPYLSGAQEQRKPLSPAFLQTSFETIPSSCHFS